MTEHQLPPILISQLLLTAEFTNERTDCITAQVGNVFTHYCPLNTDSGQSLLEDVTKYKQ